jgi:hypothetical protein
LSVEGDSYRVHVSSREGGASGEFHVPLSTDEQIATWQWASQTVSEGLEEIGGRLFRAVFRDEVLARFRSAWESARRERLGLRVKLILEPPELHGLPWEFLYDQGSLSYLALSNKTPLVRYVERPTPIPRFASVERLRLLAVVASPRDQPPLDLVREVGNLQAALEPARAQGWLEYRIVQGQEANAQGLLRLFRQANYHVFHFLGHGAFDHATGEGVLLLEGEDGRSDPLTARHVARLLRDEINIRLAFLNACETALTPETAPFASVAGALVQAGIPAVVATQYAISDAAASRFAQEFYRALAEFYPVEAAVAEGRKAIDLSVRNYEWGVPVLYLRAQDGRVFR